MNDGARQRRDVLRASIAMGATLVLGCANESAAERDRLIRVNPNGPADMSPTEELMREHGLLNRMLLLYDECARRIEGQLDLRADVLPNVARMIRTFVIEYHEKLEEEHVFPRFEQSLTHVDLVRTLRDQHNVGRKLTAAIEQLMANGAVTKKDDKKRLVTYVRSFTRMYRPHEAREDTVLFPDFRALLTPKELDDLGLELERREHELFGDDGFEKKVAELDQLEIALDMHDLGQLTPGGPELR